MQKGKDRKEYTEGLIQLNCGMSGKICWTPERKTTVSVLTYMSFKPAHLHVKISYEATWPFPSILYLFLIFCFLIFFLNLPKQEALFLMAFSLCSSSSSSGLPPLLLLCICSFYLLPFSSVKPFLFVISCFSLLIFSSAQH